MAETEEKKYLVNIESNLDKYSQEAADAKKKVDELTKANEELVKSGTASQKEIEANNAALRTAKKEYADAKKMVDLQTAANNSNANSRKQLSEILNLEMRALGKLGDGMVKNEKGVLVLNQAYIDQQKKIANTKQAIIDYDLALNDGRSNVGRYSEALQSAFSSVSPQLGNMISKGKEFIGTITKIGPIGSIISASIVALSAPLVAFFSKTEKGIELLERKTAGFKAAWSVLVGEFASGGEKIVDSLDKTEKKTSKIWTILTSLLGPAWTSVGVQMDIASKAAENYVKQMQELEDLETSMIVPRAEANLQIKQARLLYEDETKSQTVRIGALQKALDLEGKVADAEIKMQNAKTLLISIDNDRLKASGLLRDENIKALQQSIADGLKLEEESAGRKLKVQKALSAAKKEMLNDEMSAAKDKYDYEMNLLEAEQKMKKAFFDEWKKKVEEEKNITSFASDFRKLLGIKEADLQLQQNKGIAERNKKGAEAASEEDIRITQEREDKKLRIINAAYEGATAGADAAFTAKKNRLQAELTAELSNKNLTEEQKNIIQIKYAKKQQQIDISQALINGALAIGNALATTKPFVPAGLIAGGIAAIQTAAQVAAIRSQSFTGSGGSTTSIPTSISQPRMAAPPANIFNQPTQSQSQLNALPNQGFDSDSLINALKSMPAPIVTVEDINEKTKQKIKVDSRANI